MERAGNGAIRIYRPDGTSLPSTPPGGALGPEAVASLSDAQASLGITADTGQPTWDGMPVDYEWGAQALWRAVRPEIR